MLRFSSQNFSYLFYNIAHHLRESTGLKSTYTFNQVIVFQTLSLSALYS